MAAMGEGVEGTGEGDRARSAGDGARGTCTCEDPGRIGDDARAAGVGVSGVAWEVSSFGGDTKRLGSVLMVCAVNR